VPETFLVQKVGIDQVVQVGHPMVVRENRARIDQAVVEKEEEEELRLHLEVEEAGKTYLLLLD